MIDLFIDKIGCEVVVISHTAVKVFITSMITLMPCHNPSIINEYSQIRGKNGGLLSLSIISHHSVAAVTLSPVCGRHIVL